MESGSTVRVHPVVLASIVDAYERRKEGSERVIGTLLGVWGKSFIEVTNSFGVPHEESSTQVSMDFEFAKNMASLERMVNRTHCIVGWYATGNEITEHFKWIHQDYYMQHVKNAIFLMVDTTLNVNEKSSVRAYLCRPVGIPGGTRGIIFAPVEVEIECYGAERCAVEMMALTIDPRSNLQPELGDDMLYLCQLSQHLISMLDQVIKYVEDVIEEKRPANPNIGRAIAQLIFSIPKLEPDHLEQLINSSYKDLLMNPSLRTCLSIDWANKGHLDSQGGCVISTIEENQNPDFIIPWEDISAKLPAIGFPICTLMKTVAKRQLMRPSQQRHLANMSLELRV